MSLIFYLSWFLVSAFLRFFVMSHFSLNVFKIFLLFKYDMAKSLMYVCRHACVSVCVFNSMCLFFDFHGTMFCCLSFILENSQPLILH